MPITRKRQRELEAKLEAGNSSSSPDSVRIESATHPGKRARRSSKLTPKPIQTPSRNQVEIQQPGLGTPHSSTVTEDSDENFVPTSQSQDLKPYFISPPRPGGTVLKDTTPKPLRQSQGHINQALQPLPSVMATIQGHARTQGTNAVPTSQMEETELRLPQPIQAGASRALAFSSPSPESNCDEIPPSERMGVYRTPKKLTGFPLSGKVNIGR